MFFSKKWQKSNEKMHCMADEFLGFHGHSKYLWFLWQKKMYFYFPNVASRSYRYEDFSMDPANNTVEVKISHCKKNLGNKIWKLQVFKFFGLSVHRTVVQFLDSHTKSNKGLGWTKKSYHCNFLTGGVSSTFQNSKTAPLKLFFLLNNLILIKYFNRWSFINFPR